MGRPEIATSAAIVVAGFGLALWLAWDRPPPTPRPPEAPAVALAVSAYAPDERRPLPEMAASFEAPGLGLGPFGLPCGPVLKVHAASPGIALVALDAACSDGEVVEFSHGPIRFSERMPEIGTLRLEVPVVAADAAVTVRLGNTQLSADLPPDSEALPLDGLVFDPELALRLVSGSGQGAGGRMMHLGDPALGMLTHVHVAPDAPGAGSLRLNVEAVEIPELCGSEPRALVVFRSGASGLVERKVRLGLSPCTGDDGPVVLKHLVADRKMLRR